jgi:signal transduction histidine kinase
MLLEAGADLAAAKADPSNWPRNFARASHWLARLIPLWREAVSAGGGGPDAAAPGYLVQPAPAPADDPAHGAPVPTDALAQAAPAPADALAHGAPIPADAFAQAAPVPGEFDAALRLIDEFLAILAARVPLAARDTARNASIEKAKHEWEFTADALSAMVCLLNPEGVVLRANRVVEHWGLGSVSAVIGKKAHAVLHPHCAEWHCKVARDFEAALPKLRLGEPQEFESYSKNTDQTLQFTLRPMRTGEETGAPKDTRTVLVVTDVSALRRAQRALEEVNIDLESRVRLRTRELNDSNRHLRSEVVRRELAELELRASRNDLALLSEQLIQAQEVERRRIALELHDSVGQSLSAIKYTLERAIIMVQRGNLGSPEGVLALAVQRIHETADGIRAISMNLRPQMLDNLGAASATSWFCRGFAEIYPQLSVRAEIAATNSEIPPRIATHLFRAVEELLNNVAKHAQAANVWVTVKRDARTLSLEVRDDGVGMPAMPEGPSLLHGSGIRNLRERADMTCGQFSLASVLTGGTSAQIVWPLNPEDAGEAANDGAGEPAEESHRLR